MVSDATWSAFNGRLASVAEGQAYFSRVHRASEQLGGVAGALRRLQRQRPQIQLFAAEEFCDQEISEADTNMAM